MMYLDSNGLCVFVNLLLSWIFKVYYNDDPCVCKCITFVDI